MTTRRRILAEDEMDVDGERFRLMGFSNDSAAPYRTVWYYTSPSGRCAVWDGRAVVSLSGQPQNVGRLA